MSKADARKFFPFSALVWIRDGVLIDRMPLNALAFAYCYQATALKQIHTNSQKSRTRLPSITTLTNFALAKSGISCAAKAKAFAESTDVEDSSAAVARLYNQLCNVAATECCYFPGALDLLKDLHLGGVKNFISSALEQEVLDLWLTSKQGLALAPYLTEAMGKREAFEKGQDHFAHVTRLTAPTREKKICYVADARQEILQAEKCKASFKLLTVGFAHCLTREKFQLADELIMKAIKGEQDLRESPLRHYLENGNEPQEQGRPTGKLNLQALDLPVQNNLADAGADFVVEGEGAQLFARLRQRLEKTL